MFKKILCLMGVLVLVSACSSDESTDSAANQSGLNSGRSGTGVGSGMDAGGPAAELLKVGDRIFFEFNSSDVTGDARATLGRQAAWLKKYSNINVTIEGHCDERGTREYNLALGDRRATAVKNYLVAEGISAGRVKTISYGKERPAVLGHNEEAWAQNRRGVTVVLQ